MEGENSQGGERNVKLGKVEIKKKSWLVYTRYFRVADEKQKNKKTLGAISLFKLSKGGDLKKEFRKPWFKLKFEFSKIFN